MVEVWTICRCRTSAPAGPEESAVVPARAGTRNCRKHKNSRNELKKLLKKSKLPFLVVQNELKTNWFLTAKPRNSHEKRRSNHALFANSEFREGATWGRDVQTENLTEPQRRRGSEVQKQRLFSVSLCLRGDQCGSSRLMHRRSQGPANPGGCYPTLAHLRHFCRIPAALSSVFRCPETLTRAVSSEAM